jgi:hypothetical protein
MKFPFSPDLLRPPLLALGLAAAILPLAGCNFVVLRSGHTAYLFGELNTSLDHAFLPVGAAVATACTELGWTGSGRQQSLVDTVLTRRTDLGRAVVIKVEQTGRASSRIRIRVGAGGDEAASRRLLERLRTILPPAPAAVLAAR